MRKGATSPWRRPLPSPNSPSRYPSEEYLPAVPSSNPQQLGWAPPSLGSVHIGWFRYPVQNVNKFAWGPESLRSEHSQGFEKSQQPTPYRNSFRFCKEHYDGRLLRWLQGWGGGQERISAGPHEAYHQISGVKAINFHQVGLQIDPGANHQPARTSRG